MIWTSITAYANYLWYRGDYDACAAIVAVLDFELAQFERGHAINNKYFLRPLISRVKQMIGDDVWLDAIDTAERMTIEQVLQEIVYELKIE